MDGRTAEILWVSHGSDRTGIAPDPSGGKEWTSPASNTHVMYRRSGVVALAVALSALVVLPTAAAPANGAIEQAGEQAGGPTLRVGVGVADATWHVGAGGGQYAEKAPPDPTADDVDPHVHSLTQQDSYGIASRLTTRAIVVEGTNGRRVALVKSDLYLAQNHLLRRVGQLLAEAGSTMQADDILHSASHNHSSPYYTTPSVGVWAFQDAADLRAFEYQARAMRDAILDAEAALTPARMGATVVQHDIVKSNIAGRGVSDDGTPFGYPEDFGDDGLTVLRFDALDGSPIGVWVNWGQHPESLDGYDLITADYLGPLERFVDRAVGAPLLFTQGDVGSAEGPYYRDPDDRLPDGTVRAWAHVGHAQAERGARLLADSVLEGWERIGTGDVEVPLSSDVPVDALTYWAPGPVSHPYPSVSNCRSEETLEGDPGIPVAGLPDCERGGTGGPLGGLVADNLRAHGIPVPDHYDVPSVGAVEENARMQLQVARLGDVILGSCSCEAQVDLILNFESRANDVAGDIWDGFPWDEHCDQNADGTWQCPDPRVGVDDRSVTVTDGAFRRMEAQIHNDAAGWDDPSYAAQANSEPADPAAIKGNFTKEELAPERGYRIAVGLGHTGDYNGYTVSYREYRNRDHYRKALTAYGPHTADYMVTRLVRMAGSLNGGPPVPEDPLAPVATLDELRQEATSQGLGRAAGATYDAWRTALPDDAGVPEIVEQPADIERFDAAFVRWRGGSNAVDDPNVRVERLDGETWRTFADQSGEIQTMVDFPDGLEGVAATAAGQQEWIWTAGFEAFDAAPATLGQTPTGTYRFVVEGRQRSGGVDHDYRLESEPFAVGPWTGITVSDLRADDRVVSFLVDPITYPRTYESPFPYVRDDGDPVLCKTCSFRPWATTGQVDSATVTIEDHRNPKKPKVKTVEASLVDGRWVAPARLRAGQEAVVRAGDVVDQWGEINGTEYRLGADGTVTTTIDSAGAEDSSDATVADSAATPSTASTGTGDADSGLPIANTRGVLGLLVTLFAVCAAVLLARPSRRNR